MPARHTLAPHAGKLRDRGRVAAKRLWCLGLAAALLLGSGPHAQAAGPRVLFEKKSPYSDVVVIEENGKRCLRFGAASGDDQSCTDLKDPDRVVFEYVRYLATTLLFVEQPKSLLMIGLGGGSTVRLLQPRIAGLKFDIVELDPVVVQAARDYFGIRETSDLRIHIGDGRRFVEAASVQWDVVLLDAYGEDNVPFSLTTVEFLRAVAARTAPRGAVVANLWCNNERLYRAMLRTYIEIWPALHVFATPTDQNCIVVATHDPLPLPSATIMERARRIASHLRFPFDYLQAARRYQAIDPKTLQDAPVLTDSQPQVHQDLMKAVR